MAGAEALHTHLSSGVTTVARCWEVRRKDDRRFGFTDHDLDLSFDGLTFRADTGMSAAALQQGTGLSVDNSEAIGALSDASVTETDIAAGRFDGAAVTAWLVNWADVTARKVLFRGSLGEITRSGGGFSAELRGLTEMLNRPGGRVFQKPCSAVLGDQACRLDLDAPGMSTEATVLDVSDIGRVTLAMSNTFEAGWFQRGRMDVLDGDGAGLWAVLKRDVLFDDGTRAVDLWEPLRVPLTAGNRVRLVVGCDKRVETGRAKFNNLLNYQGFPDIPQEEWVMVHPTMTRNRNGGSLR